MHKIITAVGAAALLSTLVSAPASASGPSGAGTAGTGATMSTFAKHAKAPAAACKELTADGGFETPKLGSAQWKQFNAAAVAPWRTDDPANKIEIWSGGMGVPARFGKQFAELNATGQGNSIYQDIVTKANTKIYWSFWIRARDSSDGTDVDATQIHFARAPKNGSGGVNGVGSAFSYSNSSDDVHWKRLYGWYMTGSGQTSTRVTLTAVDSASTDPGYGNLVDGLTIAENPSCV